MYYSKVKTAAVGEYPSMRTPFIEQPEGGEGSKEALLSNP